MTKASLEAYLQNIESGRAESQSERIIALLMDRKFADTWQISQASGVKVNTVGARLKALLSIGCVYPAGESEHEGTMYSRYMWVHNKNNWPIFGKVYRKGLARRRAQSIVNNAGDHSKGLAIRAQLEVEQIEKEIEGLMNALPKTHQV